MCSSIYLVWDSLYFLDLGDCLLSHIRLVLHCNLFKYFLRLFSFSSSSGTPVVRKLVHLMLSQRSLRLSLFLFCFVPQHLFPPFFSFSSLFHSFASVILLLIPSDVFFFSDCTVCLYLFSSSRFVKHFLHILDPCLHSFFGILDHVYHHYSEFFFR